MRQLLVLLAALLISLAAALTSSTLSPQQEVQAQRVGDHLRCPICSGESVTQSQSKIAAQMMGQVREMVASGRNDTQIYDFFAARFGQKVLLDPPKRGANLALWLAPLAALGGGGLLLARFLRGASRPVREETDPALLARVQRDLEAGR